MRNRSVGGERARGDQVNDPRAIGIRCSLNGTQTCQHRDSARRFLWGSAWIISADWRIKAGLSLGGMQLFRQMACKEVEAGDYAGVPVLSGGNNTFLYQAYVGRVQVSSDKVLTVFVDDEAIKVGTTSTLVGDVSRTWYDGISYAVVNRPVSVSEEPGIPIGFGLSQNYPNPFNPSTEIEFTLPSASNVSLVVYDILGKEVVSLVNGNVKAGSHSVRWNAGTKASGVYYAMFTAHDGAGILRYRTITKLVLIK